MLTQHRIVELVWWTKKTFKTNELCYAKRVYSYVTLNVVITTAADDISNFWAILRENKTDISCESSVKRTIHMKYQVLIS